MGRIVLGSVARGLSPDDLAFFSGSLMALLAGGYWSARNCRSENGRGRPKFLVASTVEGG